MTYDRAQNDRRFYYIVIYLPSSRGRSKNVYTHPYYNNTYGYNIIILYARADDSKRVYFCFVF